MTQEQPIYYQPTDLEDLSNKRDLQAAIIYLQLKQEEYNEADFDMSYEDAINNLTDFTNKLREGSNEED